jgi:hypothetical protein
MDGNEVKAYLAEVCRRLDEGRPLSWCDIRRALANVATPVVISLAMVGIGCGEKQDEVPLYGVAFEDVCDDGLDNDGNGDMDCDDKACVDDEACLAQPAYGVPFEAECDDELDNDGDGAVDCDDSDCFESCAVVLYGLPMPDEQDCSDGVDNDGDGAVDCDDDDCLEDLVCGAVGE